MNESISLSCQDDAKWRKKAWKKEKREKRKETLKNKEYFMNPYGFS